MVSIGSGNFGRFRVSRSVGGSGGWGRDDVGVGGGSDERIICIEGVVVEVVGVFSSVGGYVGISIVVVSIVGSGVFSRVVIGSGRGGS